MTSTAPPCHKRYFTPLDICIDALAENRLVFDLVCPECGHRFRGSVSEAALGPARRGASPPEIRCAGCLQPAALSGPEVRNLFERKLTEALETAEADDDRAGLERLGLVIAQAVELLEPWVMIFVVGFMAQAIGHYLQNTHLLLIRLRKALAEPPLLLAFPPRAEANQYLTRLWRQRFIISPAVLVAYNILSARSGHRRSHPKIRLRFDYYAPDLDNLSGHGALVPNITPPRHSRHLIDLREWYWRDDGLGEVTDPAEPLPFAFGEEDRAAGRRWLESKGLEDREFVCFLGRDDTYTRGTHDPNHWMHNSYRNMDIQNYVPAMEWLAERSVPSIRLGFMAASRLETEKREILDYACSGERTEFLDLYLSARCLFYVSSGSGLGLMARMAHRPLLYVNMCQYTAHTILVPGAVVIFKKMWGRREGRFLSIREVFERHLESCYLPAFFEEAGVDFVENSPEEIRASVEEMWRRVRGDWVETEEEKKLQAAYLDLRREYYPGYAPGQDGRLGYSFLKMNPYLLADA